MKKIILIMLTLLVITLMTSGCSGGDSESASATVQPGSSQSSQASSLNSQQASGESGSQGQQIKPEQLISKDEAVKLVGESVKSGVSEEFPLLGLSTCFYAPEKSDSKNYLQICLIQQSAMSSGGGGSEQSGGGSQSSQPDQSSQPSGGGGSGSSGGNEMSPKSLYEGLKKLFSDPNTAITGRLGDDTFVSAQGICVLSGEHCIVILVGNPDPALAEKTIKEAGELAVNNLKRIQGK